MMGFWEKYTWLFVIISMIASVGTLCCATYIYEKNCQERMGDSYSEKRLNSWAAFWGQKICAFFCRIWTGFHKSSQPCANNEKTQGGGQKRIPWSREIQPFVLVCVASIILPNALLVAAQKVGFAIPSPLSYENTFLMIVPLAWTVGIAFFQYRIQNELIGAETKAKEAENKQKMQQQEELRRGELISALGSLYGCDLTAYNFNTRSLISSNKMKRSITSTTRYALEIANKNGAPCFFLPYYVFENGLSKDVIITLDGKKLENGNYSIVANALSIFIPLDDTTDSFHDKIENFFVAPSCYGYYEKSNSEKLKIDIKVHAKDPFYKSNDESIRENKLSSIDYTISFELEPFGGYSSNGSFPMQITGYSIECQ